LHHDAPADGVHGAGDIAPRLHLRVVVQARSVDVAVRHRGDGRAFGVSMPAPARWP
jgi:hypothetical protein